MAPSAKILSAVDLFCGAGGASAGARLAGVEVAAAVDTWPLAAKVYEDNFPSAQHHLSRAEDLDPRALKGNLPAALDLLIASPECTSHTCARGNGARSEASRMTAFEVIRYARALAPRWIVVENVIHMRSWSRYAEWLAALEALGYHLSEQILNAADFGVPQSRKRLFVCADRQAKPLPIRIPRTHRQFARAILDLNGSFSFSPLRSKRRAKSTLARARRAIKKIGPGTPFLLVYYGSDGSGGWQGLDVPLRTVTTVDRFAIVRPKTRGYEMRMLQVGELRKAMGFPAGFVLRHGTRRDRIHLLGNAVCPPVMAAVIRSLTRA